MVLKLPDEALTALKVWLVAVIPPIVTVSAKIGPTAADPSPLERADAHSNQRRMRAPGKTRELT